MSRSVRTLVSCVGLSLVIGLCGTSRAGAQGFTLSGIVFGGGSPLPGTTVEALQDGTTVVIESATTDSAGRYAVTVAAATYDVRVSPPAGSGFGQEVIQNIVVSGTTTHDFILLSANREAHVSGIVRGLGGQPVENAQVRAYSATTGEFLSYVTTGADGRYAFLVTEGPINLYTEGNGSASTPSFWYWYRYGVQASGNLQIDTELAVVRVSGVVRDAAGAPVPNVNLSASGSTYDSGPRGFNANVASAADGSYSFLAVEGPASVTLTPPSDSPFTRFTESLNFTGDLAHDFVMPVRVTATVSGTVRGLAGQPVENAQVRAYSATTGEFLNYVTTGADGRYSFLVTEGPINLYTEGNGSSSTPSFWYWYRYGVQASGNLQIDTELAVVRVSGVVRDAAGTPVPNVNLSASGSTYDNGPRGFNANVASAADGSYSFLAVEGPASVTLTPPSDSPFTRFTESLDLTGDLARDFVMPVRVTATVSGTVRGLAGQPVENAQVRAYSATTGEFLNYVTTGADGRYSLLVTEGPINLYTEGNGSASTPSFWYWYRYGLLATGDLQVDTELAIVRVSGVVTDSNGAPVPSVSLSASGSLYDNGPRGFSANVASAADGTYSFLALASSASLQIRPPQGSGFASTNLNGLDLTGNLEQSVVLQRPDSTPPQIVGGPVVIHLSDTSVSIAWTTNEPANSVVDFGIGGLQTRLTSNTLSTDHLATLIDLDAQAIYSYRAASTDRSGNGPATSPVGTFTTQAPPGDVTPPVFTSTPAVVFVDQTTAIVQWTTDEPATSQVLYGPTEALGSSRLGIDFETTHTLRISGLAVDTEYLGRARSSDPDGNRTESVIFSFRTLAVPDTQPPVITAGPSFAAVTDRRLTVSWSTDEPATSGVSYNDGTLFNVVTDETLTREHSITLSGLTPQTVYHVTVSSRDAVANGPTLGLAADVETAATADTAAPLLSGLTVVSLTESSAVVRWLTDEPASGVVRFGVSALDHQLADLGLSGEHEFRLGSLAERTTYRLVVRSTDASGNVVESGEASFTTLSSVVDTPPTPASGLAATPNPSQDGTHTLTWVPALDSDGPIASYRVFRNGSLVATLPGSQTSYAEGGLPAGLYSYVVRALDGAAHSADSAAYAVVVDTTPPVVVLPANVITPATSPRDALVSYTVDATDDRDSSPSVHCAPASGSSFAIGTTNVDCTATDAAGNTASGSFSITVVDVFAPVLTVPAEMRVNATGPTGLMVTFTVTAIDNVDADPRITCSPASGTLFAIGTTAVSCNARDAAGNVSPTASFPVTVAGSATQLDAAQTLLLGFGLPAGVSNSLQSKLVAAASAPNVHAGCGNMNAFLNQVNAQSGKALTPAQAAQLLSAGARIMQVMGCQ